MGEWTPEEIALVESLTEQLSVTLESARFYQDKQRRAAQERLVSQVTARIRETLDTDTILQTAISEIAKAMGIPKLQVRLATSVAAVNSRADEQ